MEETISKMAKIETLKKIMKFDKTEYVKNLEKISKLESDITAVREDLYIRYFDAPEIFSFLIIISSIFGMRLVIKQLIHLFTR